MDREKRKLIPIDMDGWWQHLTMAQKFTANSLTRYGYELQFVRQTEKGKVAFFQREHELATIEHAGDVDLKPDVKTRSS